MKNYLVLTYIFFCSLTLGVLPIRDVNPEEAERGDFSQQRGQGRAADAHLGQTYIAEDQGPVEEDIDHSHDERWEGNDLGAADADIERAEQKVEHHEEDAELPEPQVFIRRHLDILRLYDDFQ